MNTSQNDSVTPLAPSNPGETLRKGREARGWSLAEVATQLRLKSQTLAQLEAGEFDRLPGHTFARGYVRSYAKLLGMDPSEMVAAFDRCTGTDAKGSEVHSLGTIKQPMRLPQSILRFVSLALLLVLLVFGLLWWQESSTSGAMLNAFSLEHIEVDTADGTTQIHPLDEPQEPIVQSLPLPSPEQPPEPAEEVASESAVVAAKESTEPVPAPEKAEEAVAAATAATDEASLSTSLSARAAVTAPVGTSESQSAPASTSAEGTLRINFSADCWIQVTDASGKVLLSGLKHAGDAVDLHGRAPLGVRLGYARGAQLSYNGQPVDVAPFIRGQTARLKVGNQPDA